MRKHGEEDLIMLTNHFIDQAGDLSLVTIIGCKGSKCKANFLLSVQTQNQQSVNIRV